MEKKIMDDPKFNKQFPESYPWGSANKITASEVGYAISEAIKRDIKTLDRNLTPGLRQALLIMAEYYDL